MKGYVYLIYDSDKDVYKIGVTRNDDKRRINALQTGNSTKLEVIYMIATNYPFKIESALHNIFSHKKVLNEWYKLSNVEVNAFPAFCESYELNFKVLDSTLPGNPSEFLT